MKKQQGFTLIGFIFTAIFICVMGVLAMRIVPVYIQHYQVVQAVKRLNDLPQTEFKADKQQVKMLLMRRLMNQLYVNEIRFVKRKNIKIKYKNKKYIVKIAYIEERPLVFNMRILFDFDTVGEVSDRDT